MNSLGLSLMGSGRSLLPIKQTSTSQKSKWSRAVSQVAIAGRSTVRLVGFHLHTLRECLCLSAYALTASFESRKNVFSSTRLQLFGHDKANEGQVMRSKQAQRPCWQLSKPTKTSMCGFKDPSRSTMELLSSRNRREPPTRQQD